MLLYVNKLWVITLMLFSRLYSSEGQCSLLILWYNMFLISLIKSTLYDIIDNYLIVQNFDGGKVQPILATGDRFVKIFPTLCMTYKSFCQSSKFYASKFRECSIYQNLLHFSTVKVMRNMVFLVYKSLWFIDFIKINVLAITLMSLAILKELFSELIL